MKQYLNTPSDTWLSLENELFIYEDPNRVVWTIPYKGIFSYYDEKSRELKVYFTPGRNHIPYSPIIKTTYVDKQNNLWIKSQRSFIKCSFPPSPYTYRSWTIILIQNHFCLIATNIYGLQQRKDYTYYGFTEKLVGLFVA